MTTSEKVGELARVAKEKLPRARIVYVAIGLEKHFSSNTFGAPRLEVLSETYLVDVTGETSLGRRWSICRVMRAFLDDALNDALDEIGRSPAVSEEVF